MGRQSLSLRQAGVLNPMPGSSALPSPKVLVNIALFQAGWFSCVLGAAHGNPWLGMSVVALIVAASVLTSARPGAQLQLMVLTGLVGYSWDSWLAVSGLIAYPPGPLAPPLAPLWILALWLLLATTLNVSLRWLQARPPVAAMLGALAAPLAYIGAERLGALTLLRAQPALWALAAGWALLLPLLLLLARRLNG
jgi:Protein of unknown function (DUF2878)